ncbi:MAG: 50S ribosomal protein L5 [Candidatus Bathyarchaeia archaeon]
MSVLLKEYQEHIRPKLQQQRGYKNILEVPRLEKIVITTGIGTAKDREVFNEAIKLYEDITGQHPVITKAKKAISNFKLRKGMNVGVMVTLRGKRMYDFFYRLVNIALPRVRDFRGVNPKSFDGRGNYNLGIREQTIFTEVDLDKMKHIIGMNITICTTAKTNEEAYELLQMMGMPFAK